MDVQESAARAATARRLAAEQADAVAACKSGASDTTIDLFLLLQESVLVFDEIHAQTALTAEQGTLASAEVCVDTHRPSRRRKALFAMANAVAFLAFLVAAATLVEILDPAPMDVLAVGVGMRSR